MVVYLDVLIFDNMLLNISILMSVSGYMKKEKRVLFIFLSAMIGTAYSVIMALSDASNVINSWILKFALSIVMVVVAFYPKTIREFMKYTLCFYIVTFIFAGLAIAMVFLWGQTLSNNGMMYFYWSSPIKYLIVVAVLGFWLIKKFIKIIHKKRLVVSQIVDLAISICGSVCVIPALVDTGNELQDPLTGQAVVVVEFNKIKKYLPSEFAEFIETGKEKLWNNVNDLLLKNETDSRGEQKFAERFRLVPFRSLGCEHGILPAVRSDYIQILGEITENNVNKAHESVVVCFSLQQLTPDESYFALIGTNFSMKENQR